MSIAPLQDMTLIKVPQDGSNEVFNRLDQNMKYFKVNYIILCIIVTTIVLTILNPYFLIAFGFLIAITGVLLHKKDPIKVGDNDFLKVTVLARFYLALALILYASIGGVAFLIALASSFILCCIHSILCDVEATRDIKGGIAALGKDASDADKAIAHLIARGYEMLCLAIGLKESNEIYNMASVPSFVAKELKDDIKHIKQNIKNMFKD